MIGSLKQNKRTSAFLAVIALACTLSVGSLAAHAQTSRSPLPAPTGHVNDYANVIDASTRQRLETILENLKHVAQIESAIVTIKTTGGQDIYDYSLAVARGWGIGAKDGERAGLLLLVAIDDHKYFTQVSRHLEGDLPDGIVGQIQREVLVPAFRQGQYGKGISDTMETYVATLAEKRGFSIEGLDQKRAYSSQPESDLQTKGGIPICFIVIVIVVLLFIFSRAGRGGGGGGCLNLLLLNSVLNSGRSSGGWSGGGFGGSGGGGGGFGGFGGGGDFGGGGAGGSW
jgi:uncharacterized protein